MMPKIAVFLIAIALMGAGAYWAYFMVEENTRLDMEVVAALETNSKVVADNNYLLNEIRTRDADILARDTFITELAATTAQIKGELADAKIGLSVEEVSCLESDVPTPYRNKLRERTSQDRHEDGTAVSAVSSVPAVRI